MAISTASFAASFDKYPFTPALEVKKDEYFLGWDDVPTIVG
jgi:hypothetical protein